MAELKMSILVFLWAHESWLLALQEQQRKQLELILTIAKSSKLFESSSSKQAPSEQKANKAAEEPSTAKQVVVQ